MTKASKHFITPLFYAENEYTRYTLLNKVQLNSASDLAFYPIH